MSSKWLLLAIIAFTLFGIITFILTRDSYPLVTVEPGKIYKVGIVSFGGAHTEAVVGLEEGLGELGYKAGENIIYRIVDAAGSEEKVREAGKMFLSERVNAVYSVSTPVTKNILEVVKDTPIVFNVVSDPVGAGFAKSMARPGSHLTGCSNFVGQTGPKRLEILRVILPKAKKILVLYDPQNRFSQDAIVILRDAAVTLEFSLSEVHIKSSEDVIKIMKGLKKGQYDAFFHLGEAKVSSAVKEITKIANEIKLPTVAHEESFVKNGMLAAFGPSWRDLGRQCAKILEKVLKGVSPSQIPIEIPERFNLTMNLKTAKNLGVDLPKDLLIRVDKFIE